jgi:antitoxin VapB
MAFHVKDAETDRLIREVARRKGLGLTDTIKQLAAREIEASDHALAEKRTRLSQLQDRVLAAAQTGLKADKAFYDSLYEDN